MSYKYITDRNSPGFWPGRPAAPKFIVIHHWGADGQSFDAVVNYLCRPNANTSAHYVVEAGKVACIVDPDNRAWHAGSRYGNNLGIGIECRPECTAEDRRTLAELIADIRRTYGNIPLKMHKDFKATACPGRYENYMKEIDELASGSSSSVQDILRKAQEINASGKSLETIAAEVWAGNWGNDPERSQRLRAAGYDPEAVRAIVNRGQGSAPAAHGKSLETIAAEVWAGNWGNDPERSQRLRAAGYDPEAVRAIVNRMM